MVFNKLSVISVRNFVFGVEDSLVSTVGLLSGVVIAGAGRSTIFLTGLVLIFVEAFSMAAGSFLSESSVEEYKKQGSVPARRSVGGALIMFFSYFISGFVPLFPYLVLELRAAFWVSIGLSLSALFILGVVQARFSRLQPIINGVKMFVIGGLAILVGIVVGKIIQ